jgi:hypothetical protein
MLDYYDKAVEAKRAGSGTAMEYWLKAAETTAENQALPAELRKEAASQAKKIRELLRPDPTPLGCTACDGYGPIQH